MNVVVKRPARGAGRACCPAVPASCAAWRCPWQLREAAIAPDGRARPRRGTLQVSLDSGTPELHDRHRGRGGFDRARSGIALAHELGLRTTVAEQDAVEETRLHPLLDAEGIPHADRLVRRVAHTGFADAGVRVGIDEVWPRPTLTADGAWWHPVGITDPSMQVASAPLPVVTVLAVIRATLNVSTGQRTHALPAFRCT